MTTTTTTTGDRLAELLDLYEAAVEAGDDEEELRLTAELEDMGIGMDLLDPEHGYLRSL